MAKTNKEAFEEVLDELEKEAAEKEANEEAAESTEEAETAENAEEAEETAEAPEKDKKDEIIEDLNDRLKRQMAEFENFRKRNEKEKAQMYDMGAKTVVEKILPIVDNFERGLAAVPEEMLEDSFVGGMNLVYKQILTAFEEIGVKPIEAVGCEFDPNLHNAVMHIEDENFGDNIVAEEFQKGYTYRDSVVRHSMVKVAN